MYFQSLIHVIVKSNRVYLIVYFLLLITEVMDVCFSKNSVAKEIYSTESKGGVERHVQKCPQMLCVCAQEGADRQAWRGPRCQSIRIHKTKEIVKTACLMLS